MTEQKNSGILKHTHFFFSYSLELLSEAVEGQHLVNVNMAQRVKRTQRERILKDIIKVSLDSSSSPSEDNLKF